MAKFPERRMEGLALDHRFDRLINELGAVDEELSTGLCNVLDSDTYGRLSQLLLTISNLSVGHTMDEDEVSKLLESSRREAVDLLQTLKEEGADGQLLQNFIAGHDLEIE